MDNGLTPMVQSASQNWQTVTLGDCVVTNDAIYSPNEAWPFVNYLDTGNITENRISEIQNFLIDEGTLPSRARRKVQLGDIVYSTVRPNQRHFGRIRDVPKNFLASTGFAVMRGRPETACTEYIYWFLAQDHVVEYLQTIAESSTSAYPSIRPADLEQLELSLPPLPDQRRIADILCTLDDKIELNRRMNETLEQMARALYKSWFVDFDPVRAKMDGRWHLGETLPGLPAKLYDLFPDCLVPSELGETPEGWEIKRLDQMADLNPREPMVKGTVAPYLDMAALPTSGFSPNNPVIREFTSGTRFRNGDTLLARITPCLENGKTAFVQSLPQGTLGWGSTEFVVIRSAPPVPPEYTYLLARDPRFRSYVIQSMTGTSGRQRVRTEALASYPLVCPSEDTWLAFGILVKPLFERVNSHSEETAILSAQRDALLPRLVSGELRLLDYAKPMELQRYDA